MQNTFRLLMIEPVNFGYNEQTAGSNAFQVNAGTPVQEKALKEFNEFVAVLRKNRLHVTVIKDTPEPFTPDSIFPNNWITFHGDGSVLLYPMFAVNRRNERKEHILMQLKNQFKVKKIIDLTTFEQENIFLEGTGSMVLDRVNKIVYACLSERTNPKALEEFCIIFGYQAVVFTAVDGSGKNIYHTNVMMCIGDKFAVVCLDAIVGEQEKAMLVSKLNLSGKDIIEISLQQTYCFAGNMLQVVNMDGEKLLIMSTQAFLSLSTVQLVRLQKYNRIIHATLETIESAGGGSARCMIAEIF